MKIRHLCIAVVALLIACMFLFRYGVGSEGLHSADSEHAPVPVAQADGNGNGQISDATQVTELDQHSEADPDVGAGEQAKPVRAYSPEQPLTAYNHPYMVFEGDPDPRVQSVVMAMRQGGHPERLSIEFDPQPFDLEAWERDPESYLNVVEPGRIRQIATSITESTPRLKSVGPSAIGLRTGEEAELAVRAVPHAPVSWYAAAGGVFTESRLNAITVRADADGVARVHFYAVPGVFSDAPVVSGSPLAAGNVVFTISIPAEEQLIE
jgi:hypothetical protein